MAIDYMVFMKRRKGAIMAYPELIMIIFALALGMLLFAMVSKFGIGVKNSFEEDNIIGDPDFVSETLAILAKNCWKLNKKGNSKANDVCYTLTVNSTENYTESDFNRYLDCGYLANSRLNIENESYDGCGKEDKVYWEIFNKDSEVKIAYVALRRRIEIIEMNTVCLGACCVEKCKMSIDDFNNNCEEMHSRCSGGPCDVFYENCKKTVSELYVKCTENC